MKEIQKFVQKLSREQESAEPAAAAYELVQKHKVTPSILGWLNKSINLLQQFPLPTFTQNTQIGLHTRDFIIQTKPIKSNKITDQYL